jgi:pentatricopeptide repeat protein
LSSDAIKASVDAWLNQHENNSSMSEAQHEFRISQIKAATDVLASRGETESLHYLIQKMQQLKPTDAHCLEAGLVSWSMAAEYGDQQSLESVFEHFWSNSEEGRLLRHNYLVHELLIKHLLNQSRLVDALKVQSVAQELSVPMSINTADSLITSLLLEAKWTTARRLYEQMKQLSLDRDTMIFSAPTSTLRKILIWACQQHRKLWSCESQAKLEESLSEQIRLLHRRMIASGEYADLHAYTALLSHYMLRSDITAAELCLMEMNSLGISQDHIAQAVFVLRYSKSRSARPKRAIELIRKLLESPAVYENDDIHLVAVQALTTVVSMLAKHRHLHDISDMLNEFLLKGLKPDKHLYTTLISAAAQHGNARLAEMWFDQMAERSIPTDAFTYHALMNAYYNAKEFENAVRMFEKLQSNVKDTSEEKAAGVGVTTERQPSLYMYNTLIRCMARTRSTQALNEVMDEMKSRGLTPDSITYFSLVEFFCKQNRIDSAIEALKLHADASRKDALVKMLNSSYSVLFGAMGTTSGAKMEQVETVLRIIHDFREVVSPDMGTYVALMQAVARIGSAEEVLEVWRSLRSEDGLLSKAEFGLEGGFNLGFGVVLRVCFNELHSLVGMPKAEEELSNSAEKAAEIVNFVLSQVWSVWMDGFQITRGNWNLLVEELGKIGGASEIVALYIQCLSKWSKSVFLPPTVRVDRLVIQELISFLSANNDLRLLRKLRSGLKELRVRHTLAVEKTILEDIDKVFHRKQEK